MKTLYRQCFVSIAAVTFFTALAAHANPVILRPRESFLTVRPLGMGGAFSAVADDENALFLNPAGIGREDGDDSKNLLKGSAFPFLTVSGNKNAKKAYEQYGKNPSADAESAKSALILARDADVIYGRGGMFPYLTFGRLQFGLLVDHEILVTHKKLATQEPSSFSNETGVLTNSEKIFVSNRAQTGASLGISFPYFKSGVSMGVTARYLFKSTVDNSFEASDSVVAKSADVYSKSTNKTRGMGLDIGVLYLAKSAWLPSIAVSAIDVMDSYYKPTVSNAHAEVEKMNLTAGLAFRPYCGKSLSCVVAVDGQRLSDKRIKPGDKVHAGVEIGLGADDQRAPFKFRAGHNGRAVSAGVTADLLFFKLDLASYAEPVFDDAGKLLTLDRRAAVRLLVDLRL